MSFPEIRTLASGGRGKREAVGRDAGPANLAEAGYPEVDSTSGWGLLAPAGVPKEIIDRLSAETMKLLNQADVRQRLMSEGAEPSPMTPEQFAAFIKSEMVKWANLVKLTGVKLE